MDSKKKKTRYNHVNVLLIWVVKNEDQELGAHAVIAAPAGSEYKDAMQYIQKELQMLLEFILTNDRV